MEGSLENLLAHQDLQSAQKHAHAVKDVLVSEGAAIRKTYETFYTNVALFSGGTIALSITYLGYLKSTGMSIRLMGVLIASWACLLAAVTLGFFYSFLNSHYLYYARMHEYQEALSNQKIAESGAIGKVPIVDLPSEEFEQERARLQTKAQKHASVARDSKKKEELFYWMWRCDGFAARLLFLIGLTCLFAFAVLNAAQRPSSDHRFLLGQNAPSNANQWQPDWVTVPDKNKQSKPRLSSTMTFTDDWLGGVPVLNTEEQRKANEQDIRAKELFLQAFRRSRECKGVTFKRANPKAADFDLQIFNGLNGRTGRWQWVLYRTDTIERLAFGEESDIDSAAKSACGALHTTLEPTGGNVE